MSGAGPRIAVLNYHMSNLRSATKALELLGARVQVAEMRLFEADAVQSGRAQRSLYEALRHPIDAAREIFRHTFFAPCASMVDYLDLELTRTLANDDADLLGKTYPGPLVQ